MRLRGYAWTAATFLFLAGIAAAVVWAAQPERWWPIRAYALAVVFLAALAAAWAGTTWAIRQARGRRR